MRHYQAIDVGGAEVKLDLYEGMPHGFQNKMFESPEARLAVRKTVNFVKSRLRS